MEVVKRVKAIGVPRLLEESRWADGRQGSSKGARRLYLGRINVLPHP